MEKNRIGLFLLISLLLHVILLMLIGAGILSSLLFHPLPPPSEKIRLTVASAPEKKLLEQLLQQRQQQPQKQQFIDTSGLPKSSEANPDAAFESENNTKAASEKPNDGNPNLPSQTGEENVPFEMRNSNYSPQTKPTQASQSQQPDKQQKQQEQQPQQQQAQQQQEQKDPSKEQAEAPKPSEAKQQAQEKPDDTKAEPGMKNQAELKPLKASESIPLRPDGTVPVNSDDKTQKEQKATTAQQQPTTPTEQQQQQQQTAQDSPPPATFSAQRRRAAMNGGGPAGPDTSVESQETVIGRYKAKLYRAIGSRWYIYVNQDPGLLTIGMVKIRFRVNSNGTISNIEVVQGQDSAALLAISRRSILEVSGQIEPFPRQMQLQVGDSYDEEVTFSIY